VCVRVCVASDGIPTAAVCADSARDGVGAAGGVGRCARGGSLYFGGTLAGQELVPHSFLISLRVDSSAAVSDAVASLRDAVGSEDFEEVRVFQALRDVTAPAMAGEQRRNTPHILARLSPLGVERVRVHPLVQAVEQDRVMGLVEGQFGNATCQQQSR
jgi:hypothetical protein